MILKDKEILAFCDANSNRVMSVNDKNTWIAVRCATQLSGTECSAKDFLYFENGPYTQVETSYASVLEKLSQKGLHRIRLSDMAKLLRGQMTIKELTSGSNKWTNSGFMRSKPRSWHERDDEDCRRSWA